MTDFEYIQKAYGVPAQKGRVVKFQGELGVIVSAKGRRLRVRVDSCKRLLLCHPTWEMEYLGMEEK